MSAPHDRETRAAVLAALLSGSTVSDIARRLDLPITTIRRWRDQAGIGPKAPADRHALGDETKRDLGSLVAEYLNDILISLRAQAVHTRDKAWLDRQNAHDLAILHGTLNDKAVRLLGALHVDEPITLPDPAAA